MNTAEYADLKGWTHEEENRADMEREHHELARMVDAWDALWWHQTEPDAESEAYYLRCLRDFDGGDL